MGPRVKRANGKSHLITTGRLGHARKTPVSRADLIIMATDAVAAVAQETRENPGRDDSYIIQALESLESTIKQCILDMGGVVDDHKNEMKWGD